MSGKHDFLLDAVAGIRDMDDEEFARTAARIDADFAERARAYDGERRKLVMEPYLTAHGRVVVPEQRLSNPVDLDRLVSQLLALLPDMQRDEEAAPAGTFKNTGQPQPADAQEKRERPMPVCLIDIETSGLDVSRHEITEVCVRRVLRPCSQEGAVTVHRHVNLSRPEDADPRALAISGYRRREDAVSLEVAVREAQGVVQPGDVVVVQNPDFDLAFLRRDGFRLPVGVGADRVRVIDTASMAWPMYVRGALRSVSLQALCEHYGVSNEGAHGALRDVERLEAVYAAMTAAAVAGS